MSGNPILDMLTRIDGRLGRLEERQATLEKGQAALEKGQTSLRVDLMARMDRLSDQVTLIKDDQTVTMGASDSVRRMGDATREEVRALSDMVYTTVRQLRQLREVVDGLLDKPPAS